MAPQDESTEVLTECPAFGGDRDLRQWCRAHNWAVTTEADCYGYPPKPEAETAYALYDADEDDPPVAVFSFKKDALAVAAILTEYSKDALAAEGLRAALRQIIEDVNEDWSRQAARAYRKVYADLLVDPAFTPEQNPPEFADEPPLSMVYLNGSRTSFRCRCGANVFTTGEVAGTLACNGCDAEYEGTA